MISQRDEFGCAMAVRSGVNVKLPLVVFAVALAIRLVFLLQMRASPTFDLPIVDAAGYDQMARGLVETGVMKIDFFWQQFFYPMFLSVVYYFSHCSVFAARIVQALLGCVTCVLTYYLARRLFGNKVGVTAGLIMALYGPGVFHELDLVPEGWATFWTVALLLILFKTRDTKAYLWFYLLGLCSALAVITRPNFVPFLLAAYVWLALGFCGSANAASAMFRRTLVSAVAFLFVALPVAALNNHVTGRFTIMPASGALNLYLGNNPAFDAASVRPGTGWRKLIDMPAHLGIGNDMWERQRFYYGQTLEYIKANPAGFIRGLASKTLQLVSPREMPGNVDIYLFRKWSSVLNVLVWKVGGFGFPFGILFIPAVVGMVLCRRRIPAVVWLFMLLYPPTIILAHIESRYRMPLIVPLAMLVSCGCFAVVEAIRNHFYFNVALAVVCAAVATLLLTLPGPFPAERVNLEPEIYYCAGWTASGRGQKDKAFALNSRALELNPDYADAHTALGVILAERGDIEGAIEHYNRALQIEPNSPETHHNLANALFRQQKVEEAAAHYKSAIQISPTFAEAYIGLGTSLVFQGDFAGAADAYKKALQYQGKSLDAGVYSKLGSVLIRLGRFDEAADAFRAALSRQPRDSDSRFNLGLLYARQKNYEQAIAEFETVLAFDANDTAARLTLADLLTAAGRSDQADAHLSHILKLDPNNAAAKSKLEKLRTKNP